MSVYGDPFTVSKCPFSVQGEALPRGAVYLRSVVYTGYTVPFPAQEVLVQAPQYRVPILPFVRLAPQNPGSSINQDTDVTTSQNNPSQEGMPVQESILNRNSLKIYLERPVPVDNLKD